jgi:cytochrome P450
MTSASTDPVVFDPRDDTTMQCPFPHYDRLRRDDPVHRMPGEMVGRPGETVYAVTRHDLVLQVLSDWRTYSSRFGSPGAMPPEHLRQRLREIAERGFQRPPTMLTADPPVHTRYRKLVAKAFTPRRVAELGPTVRTICEGLADELAEAGTADFVHTVCVPIPTKTIAVALGVPDERFGDFKRWADASVAPIGRTLDDDGWIASTEGVVELQQYFAAELEARRVAPRDDLLSDLLAVRLADDEVDADVEGEPLSMAEMISIIQQLQVAGSETTASLIADIVVFLADRPDEWDRIRDEPERAGAVVEECLRLASPNQGMFRIVTEDTELGGVPLAKGETLWILFGAANRDDAAYERPTDFDPDRPHVAQHLAFGRGIHFCIGAPLARLEATIALQVLAERFASITPLDSNDLRYAPSCILRGLERLDVRAVTR